MSSIIFSILSIYVFILMGYISKMSFKDKIDERTITLLNVYFLQVFLTFWGLLLHPVNITLLYAPGIYLFIVIFVLLISALFASKLFSQKKEYSIAMVASIIGNTGNLGIPLNIAIFGEASIPYTTVVNLVNVFVVYTVGVYFYSRGNFNAKTSLKNIIKLPILWAAVIAIVLSVNHYTPSDAVMNMLMMGAYASMTMQLFLFGIYLYDIKIREINKKLITWVMSLKFIFLPLIAFIILFNINLEPMIKGIIFIELLMPLAVANVNLASLYDCEPKLVTALVFISSVLFLGVIFFAVKILSYLA
ncbi:AEC family transporter [Sulfurimonas autotrophica]|uniref:Auxin Efflux Carrier n=1 Tax=Sulfurimonas autotrophica (strain ATCC BAA-671 / DSM 16294 / JCM 11897 / OK10) TaxID=563040 RepID=E0UU46_SULAO|nr:AEC family transporter [Sulfurimonas autotrophica]ADN08355.1 Auxin Efflux Carrier [Sulfurimonas autotrophica DSM 16294]